MNCKRMRSRLWIGVSFQHLRFQRIAGLRFCVFAADTFYLTAWLRFLFVRLFIRGIAVIEKRRSNTR